MSDSEEWIQVPSSKPKHRQNHPSVGQRGRRQSRQPFSGNPKKPKKHSRPVCHGFRDSGVCRFGEKCRFLHSRDLVESSPGTDGQRKPRRRRKQSSRGSQQKEKKGKEEAEGRTAEIQKRSSPPSAAKTDAPNGNAVAEVQSGMTPQQPSRSDFPAVIRRTVLLDDDGPHRDAGKTSNFFPDDNPQSIPNQRTYGFSSALQRFFSH